VFASNSSMSRCRPHATQWMCWSWCVCPAAPLGVCAFRSRFVIFFSRFIAGVIHRAHPGARGVIHFFGQNPPEREILGTSPQVPRPEASRPNRMSSPTQAPKVPPGARLPAVDPRLVEAVRDPALRPTIGAIAVHTLQALNDLSRLDDSLYTRFMEGGGRVTDDTAPRALLTRLSMVTFRGLRSLLTFLARVRPVDPTTIPPEDLQGDDETLDFNLDAAVDGAMAEGPTSARDDFDFGEMDIDTALDVIEEDPRDEGARWKELREKLSSIEYGLRSQLREFEARFSEMLEGGQIAQALEGLDDTRGSVGEGLFAVLVAVYETFLPTVDASTVAPGYLTSLERALLVRRGLADLTRVVEPQNAIVQGSGPAQAQEEAIAQIRGALEGFIGGLVFRGMRPSDRWEITKFTRALASEPLAKAKTSCEGLAKYLDSLGSINRREVLVVHDQRAFEELREKLASARTIITVNTVVAADMVHQAMALAERLYGRSRTNDELIRALREASPSLATDTEIEGVVSMLELLDES
jgi:hypothetical protein